MELYRDNILDHGQHPRHFHLLDPADVDYEAHNPLCGDRLRLTLRFGPDGRITEVGWSGEGCTISQASASMLGEMLPGKTTEELRSLNSHTVLELLGIPLSPNRMRCALLSLQALKIGIFGMATWQAEQEAEEED